ncbi:uncharacterized protein [Elaeis guineensis]|uniref:Uncharacterized protein LOC105041973 isoform X2 n=1 Tax=Elaeis guineensis var. tenera TaxID=51953 RepID=A0A8N4EWR3_ELAGV|nr:uncharacterized protein LOC105041973 isoform X2 [Elaeis guineensis]
MLKREALRLFFCQFQTLWSIRASMASTKHPFSASFCGFSQSSESYEQGRHRRQGWVDMGISSRKISFNALRLRSCMGRHEDGFRRVDDETGKAHAMPPYCLSLHDSEVVFREEVGAELVNGNGACRHGNPLEFSDHSMLEKLVVAVDVDEVLGSFLSALNQFIADHYSSNHSLTEYYVYEFFKIWNCSRVEADIRVHEFFKTVYFKEGIHPIPGARHVLHKLSTFCNLSVVTSRQNAIKDDTLKWIEEHYPGLFQEIHFGNHFALDGQSRPKSEICKCRYQSLTLRL